MISDPVLDVLWRARIPADGLTIGQSQWVIGLLRENDWNLPSSHTWLRNPGKLWERRKASMRVVSQPDYHKKARKSFAAWLARGLCEQCLSMPLGKNHPAPPSCLGCKRRGYG